ncbi:uncharacterized protein LOC123309302 isoform X2 [Coccinella septempunctata]|uniref:uncharacterized protein LOC123309302 isoform X2 n=1 Tax=Coccinella septempunctata TaxID=41139 RepID=UPI001D06ECCA|nr:uncharacterized protein LOC123309302 isoform X2 [Coccinella septempunctata]
MTINRVQKLLFSEYCDFEDMVLIESPFAQTTKEGQGLRQVYLGLTPSKLVLATDVIPPVEKSCTHFNPGIDPDIETFELIAIYPVECVNLTVFSKQKRQALKAHFCNNSVLYFELGGFEKREMFWNLWQERIRFLSPDIDNGSSKSQTSVASSSTTSTLYLVDSREIVKANGLKQVWCKFGTGNSQSNLPQKWSDRFLYMGKHFEDRSLAYVPRVKKPTLREFVHQAKLTRNKTSPCNSDIVPNSSISQISHSINRFGNGIKDNCSNTLIMPIGFDENQFTKRTFSFQELIVMAERCIEQWESYPSMPKIVHKRRYGLCPHPHFLHGLGPWKVPPGCKYSVQVKRAVSTVTIKRQPTETELRLPISRRQLLTTISYDDFNTDRLIDRWGTNSLPVILFWTPCYWYRPRTAKNSYDELQDHLSSIKEWRESKHSRRKALKKFFRKKKIKVESETNSDMDIDSLNTGRIREKEFRSKNKYSLIKKIDSLKNRRETPLQRLKKSLKMTVILSAWDFDSTTLAQQLTLIDKELMVRVTGIELGTIIWQQSSKNTPNISAIIAFAHRISCLVTTEILREESEKIRARLIARFINVAEKCHRMSNYQSCKTVLCGLQSLAVFRLRVTWAYVRKKHASSYEVFEYLCRLYRDIRLSAYQKSFHEAAQEPPYLPQIADILGKLLDRIPEYKLQPMGTKGITSNTDLSVFEPLYPLEPVSENNNSTFMNFFMSMKNMIQLKPNDDGDGGISRSLRIPFTFKTLHSYFKPLAFYEDNKIRRLQETTKFLYNCQLAVSSYSFNRNELAKNYLLKARYKEDKENFYISLNIEPPIFYDKFPNKNY